MPRGQYLILEPKRQSATSNLSVHFKARKVHFSMPTVSYEIFVPANGPSGNAPLHGKIKVPPLPPRPRLNVMSSFVGPIEKHYCDRQIAGSLLRLGTLISYGICQTSCLAAKGSRKLN